MHIFKKILSGIGLGLMSLVGLLLTILVLPIALAALIIFSSMNAYAKLWASLRHDPKRNLALPELSDDNWPAEDKDGYIASFERLSDKLAKLAHAEKGYLLIEDMGLYEDQKTIDISKSLSTKHGSVNLMFSFLAFPTLENGISASMLDDDSECGTYFPPINIQVEKPELHIKRNFTLASIEDIQMVLSLLRGDVRYTHNGQMWGYIPEHKVWLVQYKVNKSAYGLRNEFTGKEARQYRSDK